MAKRRTYREDNKEFHTISVRSLVADPQFRSGYRDYLALRPPKRFFYDPKAGKGCDTWGYERGRMLACWLLATGQRPPAVSNVATMARLYLTAQAQDVIL